jgi:hypothetical protein
VKCALPTLAEGRGPWKPCVFEPSFVCKFIGAIGQTAPCQRGDGIDHVPELSFRWMHLAGNLLDDIALLTWRRESWQRSRQIGEPIREDASQRRAIMAPMRLVLRAIQAQYLRFIVCLRPH